MKPAPGEAEARTFLFLQGPPSFLFAAIARELEALGHRCLRVNICMGDWMVWRHRHALNYRGDLAGWPAFVERLLIREKITDIVLLGEERPHHRPAIEIARRLGIEVYCVELGYLRPDWLSLERGGGGSNSHFPVDPDQIVKAAEGLPEPDFTVRFRQPFWLDAGFDLWFNLSNVFLWFFYPYYRPHGLFHPMAEYFGWVRRLLGKGGRARHARETVARFVPAGPPFFLVPLQLQTDYQLRVHSPFPSQEDALETIIGSFANCAPAPAHLLLKLHPLDNGLIDWAGFIRNQALAFGVAQRVHVIDGGDLAELMQTSLGIVTINSTVGIQAIQKEKPLKVLGSALYDIAGLADRQNLDLFWSAPAAPEGALRAAFLRLLAASIHVRGGFFTAEAVSAGASAIARRLHERSVNEPGAYVNPPPRGRPAKLAPISRPG